MGTAEHFGLLSRIGHSGINGAQATAPRFANALLYEAVEDDVPAIVAWQSTGDTDRSLRISAQTAE